MAQQRAANWTLFTSRKLKKTAARFRAALVDGDVEYIDAVTNVERWHDAANFAQSFPNYAKAYEAWGDDRSFTNELRAALERDVAAMAHDDSPVADEDQLCDDVHIEMNPEEWLTGLVRPDELVASPGQTLLRVTLDPYWRWRRPGSHDVRRFGPLYVDLGVGAPDGTSFVIRADRAVDMTRANVLVAVASMIKERAEHGDLKLTGLKRADDGATWIAMLDR